MTEMSEIPPANATAESIELALNEIIREVLDVAELSNSEDLFTKYGMQSLKALRVVLAAQSQEIMLSLADLYKHRTIHAVAQFLAEAPPPEEDF